MKTYLALGDSYTIGEQVEPQDSFPHQLVSLLRKQHIDIADPLVIAKTGWTTDELDAAIQAASIKTAFDLVTLLIGVNNQYRGRSAEEYAREFEGLLKKAIGFAAGNPAHVFVLSIPDWGVTPFAEGRNREQIAKEIDLFNQTAEKICQDKQVSFLDITVSQRVDGNKPAYLAGDGLHPSGKEYEKWAQLLVKKVLMLGVLSK